MAQIQAPVYTRREQGGAYDDEHKADTHEAQVHDSDDKEQDCIDIEITNEVLDLIEKSRDDRDVFNALENLQKVRNDQESARIRQFTQLSDDLCGQMQVTPKANEEQEQNGQGRGRSQ